MQPPVMAAYSAVKVHYGTVLGDEIYERIDSLPIPSHSAIRYNAHPVSRATIRWPRGG